MRKSGRKNCINCEQQIWNRLKHAKRCKSCATLWESKDKIPRIVSKEGLDYECNKCHKTFYFMSDYNRHTREHQEELTSKLKVTWNREWPPREYLINKVRQERI